MKEVYAQPGIETHDRRLDTLQGGKVGSWHKLQIMADLSYAGDTDRRKSIRVSTVLNRTVGIFLSNTNENLQAYRYRYE